MMRGKKVTWWVLLLLLVFKLRHVMAFNVTDSNAIAVDIPEINTTFVQSTSQAPPSAATTSAIWSTTLSDLIQSTVTATNITTWLETSTVGFTVPSKVPVLKANQSIGSTQITLKPECDIAEDCGDQMWCGNGICVCADTYLKVNNTCKDVIGLACSSLGQCTQYVPHSVCDLSGTHTCVCKAGFAYRKNSSVIAAPDSNSGKLIELSRCSVVLGAECLGHEEHCKTIQNAECALPRATEGVVNPRSLTQRCQCVAGLRPDSSAGRKLFLRLTSTIPDNATEASTSCEDVIGNSCASNFSDCSAFVESSYCDSTSRVCACKVGFQLDPITRLCANASATNGTTNRVLQQRNTLQSYVDSQCYMIYFPCAVRNSICSPHPYIPNQGYCTCLPGYSPQGTAFCAFDNGPPVPPAIPQIPPTPSIPPVPSQPTVPPTPIVPPTPTTPQPPPRPTTSRPTTVTISTAENATSSLVPSSTTTDATTSPSSTSQTTVNITLQTTTPNTNTNATIQTTTEPSTTTIGNSTADVTTGSSSGTTTRVVSSTTTSSPVTNATTTGSSVEPTTTDTGTTLPTTAAESSEITSTVPSVTEASTPSADLPLTCGLPGNSKSDIFGLGGQQFAGTGRALDGRNASLRAVDNKIVGGQDALENEICWQAGVLSFAEDYSQYEYCGGTILNPNYVLTAMHCVTMNMDSKKVTPVERMFVAVGATDFPSRATVGQYCGKHIKIRRIIVHPDADFLMNGQRMNGISNDLALIELDESLDFSQDCVCAICLLDERPSADEQCVVSGYGCQDAACQSPPPHSLSWLKVPIVAKDSDRCQHDDARLSTDNIVCIGSTEEKDACQGDSGGPLFCYDNKLARYYLVGATSFGYGGLGRSCAAGQLARYTDVYNYLLWIRRIIQESSASN